MVPILYDFTVSRPLQAGLALLKIQSFNLLDDMCNRNIIINVEVQPFKEKTSAVALMAQRFFYA